MYARCVPAPDPEQFDVRETGEKKKRVESGFERRLDEEERRDDRKTPLLFSRE